MAKKKKKAVRRRASGRSHRRSTREQIRDLEAQIERLKERLNLEERFSPDDVHADRQRLELSAADYSFLVGVSPLTIYNWEHGRSRPRPAQLDSWMKVRKLSKRAAYNRLQR